MLASGGLISSEFSVVVVVVVEYELTWLASSFCFENFSITLKSTCIEEFIWTGNYIDFEKWKYKKNIEKLLENCLNP